MKFEKLCKSLVEKKGDTIAIIPGSFKPPHAGHMDMVKKYSKRADKVIILISKPGKQKRVTSSGKEITAKIAKKIFDLYVKIVGLKNVSVEISSEASPITSAYDYVEKNMKDGETILFGASDKGGDYNRWNKAPEYFEKKGQNVSIVPAKEASVKAFKNISASDIRDNIENLKDQKEKLPKELGNKDILYIQGLLT